MEPLTFVLKVELCPILNYSGTYFYKPNSQSWKQRKETMYHGGNLNLFRIILENVFFFCPFFLL